MSNVFTGLSIIADCIDFRNVAIVPFAMAGDYDDVLLETFYYTTHHKFSENGMHKTDSRATYGLTNLKDRLRDTVNHIFREADRQAQRERELALIRLRSELAQSNKPHVLGTVSEIAVKYGISKSEVRRRKADGTLEELLTIKKLS